MGEKDDGLGLSLRLGCAPPQQIQASLTLNLMPQFMQNNQQRSSWNGLSQSSDKSSHTRPSQRGLMDMNLAPSMTECDDEAGVSSPNSTVSSISGKRSEREPIADEMEAERASCSRGGGGGGGSDNEDGGAGGGDASRKKLRLSKEQSLVLEETFKEHNTLNPKQKLALAKQLNLRPRQVEVWFQNRRARTKLKQTEVDCEYLKRCCENLTEENRRLQKEVQELRALKLSPQLYMHMNPPTTLLMCPSCERVAVTSPSSSSSAAATSSTVTASASRCHPMIPNQQRRVPFKPWVTVPIRHQPFDGPASRS